MNARNVILAFAAAPWLVVAGCAPNTMGNTNVECRALTATTAQRPAQWGGTVFTIVMENNERGADPRQLGTRRTSTSSPSRNAVAAGYHDSYVHPSEPNYIWMVAGENFGILDDDDPTGATSSTSPSHLADQLETAGLTWKTYQESMGEPCGLTLARPLRRQAQPVRLLRRHQRLGRHDVPALAPAATTTSSTTRSSTPTSRREPCPTTCSSRRT